MSFWLKSVEDHEERLKKLEERLENYKLDMERLESFSRKISKLEQQMNDMKLVKPNTKSNVDENDDFVLDKDELIGDTK